MDFKLNMSLKELKMRTSKKCYKGVKFLKPNARETKNLTKNDLIVLCHLVRAGKLIEMVNLKLENHHNMEFLEFLDNEIALGNKKAVLTKQLFLSQKSIFSPDSLGNQTKLVKNIEKTAGLGYFPENLSEEEFHRILNQMLDEEKSDEVKKILNQRSIVVFDGDKLKAIDFVDAFDELKQAGAELLKAERYCEDEKFADFLHKQALALQTADEMLDVEADKAWAKLDKSKFEFTVTRESYDEKLTASIVSNKQLCERLKDCGITVFTKDSIGARVGLVNKKGTRLLRKLKSLVDIEKEFMPYKNEYDNVSKKSAVPQIAVDVDLIALFGDEGAYRGSVVLAQNLPNDDKPALKFGSGRRNVYHRQVRAKTKKEFYKNLITENQFKYFSPEADHWAVICHENTHTLGPKNVRLGIYTSILEEYKADMGMYAFLDEFVSEGKFSEDDIKSIMVSSLSGSFLRGMPSISQAHRTRSCMICNRMISDKAITFDDEGKLVFNFDIIKKSTKKMMEEVIRLQIDNSTENAKKYVEKWFVWTDELQKVADIINSKSHTLNGYLIEPLADEMLKTDYEKNLI